MYISITRITIVLCWLSLFAFWGLKLFGGNLFEIVVKNENFVQFCKYAESSWIKHLINAFTIFCCNYFTYGAISQKLYFKGKWLFIVIPMLISMWAVRFVPNIFYLNFWYGYFTLLLFGIISQKGFKRLFGLVAIILDFGFSSLSMITRNISLEVATNFLIGNILLIDMYLMYALYYLYSNLIRMKKER